jgi:hypothetical protein
MKYFTTYLAQQGKVSVALNTWRNASGTAFASVTARDVWGSGFTLEAKSQGPSAGGYHKPTQALERLSSLVVDKMGRDYWAQPLHTLAQRPQTWLQAVADTLGGAK